jgi:hypothetical protein
VECSCSSNRNNQSFVGHYEMYEDDEEREVEIIQSMADKDTVVNEDL